MDLLNVIETVADQRIQQRGLQNPLRVGIVSDTSPLSVIFYGDPSDVFVTLKLSSYTPAQGDKVICGYVGGAFICLGKVVTS